MLPKEYRLPKKFTTELFSSGKRIGNQAILAIYRISLEKTPRFLIIIRKKKGQRAVDRNRTKRLVREAIRKQVTMLKTPIDAVILVTPQEKTVGQGIFDSTISMLFNRINHIKSEIRISKSETISKFQ